MKRIIKTILFIIVFTIVSSFAIAFFITNNNSFLTKFKFKSITNAGLNYYVYYTKSKSSVKYDVYVYDSSNEIIYRNTTKNNSITIEFDSLRFNEVYKIIVYAFDKNGNRRSIEEPFMFLWDELDFSENNSIIMDNENDYTVEFLGNYKKKDYYLNIYNNNKLISSDLITKKTYKIKNEIFKDKKTNYKLEIVDNSVVISTMNIYNLVSPISDIKFTYPSEGDMLDYSDVNLSFTGGDNASNYLLELYRDNTLIRRKEIKDKNVILSNNLFKLSASYKVKIIASYYDYLDYSKTGEISFTINPKETLKPVYINKNYTNIKEGTKIKLLSPNDDTEIYYTIDGTEPTKDSLKFTDDITINNNMTLKAIAIKNNYNDSSVSTFNIKVGEKNKYKVYLSPSNQINNIGVSEVGYTNERKEMNDLTNYVEKLLKDNNITVYRNEPSGNINRWTQDSTYLGVDLHLAIHSNASEEHTSYGIETWVNDSNSNMYSLAWLIQNNLYSIYYKNDDKLANRGVKYARGSLGEVNPNYTPCGILIEVAHHDYLNDAKWIMENKELIAKSIVDAILEYFEIK